MDQRATLKRLSYQKHNCTQKCLVFSMKTIPLISNCFIHKFPKISIKYPNANKNIDQRSKQILNDDL